MRRACEKSKASRTSRTRYVVTQSLASPAPAPPPGETRKCRRYAQSRCQQDERAWFWYLDWTGSACPDCGAGEQHDPDSGQRARADSPVVSLIQLSHRGPSYSLRSIALQGLVASFALVSLGGDAWKP